MANDPNDPTTGDGEHQPVLDRVQQVSRNADGSAAQMDGYEVITDDDDEQAAPKRGRSRKADTEEGTTR